MYDDYDGLGLLVDPGATSYDVPEVPMMNQPQRLTRVISNFLYSAFRFEQGVLNFGRYAVFTQGLNQTGQGFPAANPLTPLHTNLVAGGRTPDGDAWTVSHIGVVFATNSDPDDVSAFCRTTHIGYTKRSMEQILGPALFWPGGAGLAGPVATTVPGVDTRQLSNGVPAASAMTKLQTPLELGSGESFSFFFDVDNFGEGAPNLNADLIVWIKLYGRQAQAVPQ